ncbi:MAG: aldo/keto reductase, partial [Pseudomonadota bacterium]
MSFLRPLGSTGLQVSALGLGTVKFGRNSGVKYPTAFELPDDKAIRNLLALARELRINLIDTAPAYGTSEARIGELLTDRKHWLLATK